MAVDPKQNTVMPWLAYARMTEDDIGSIYDYLKTVSPLDNTVEKHPRQEEPVSRRPAN